MAIIESDDRTQRKRVEILEAAQRRFIADGYAGAGMEALARDATISTATLYDHFPSKAALFLCVAEHALEALATPGAALAAAVGEQAEQLDAFANAYARFLADESVRMVMRVLSAEPRRFEPMATQFEARGRGAFKTALLAILHRLNDEGRLATPSPVVAAGQLMGMIEHEALVEPLLVAERAPPAGGLGQVCEAAVETFLARYRAPAPVATT